MNEEMSKLPPQPPFGRMLSHPSSSIHGDPIMNVDLALTPSLSSDNCTSSDASTGSPSRLSPNSLLNEAERDQKQMYPIDPTSFEREDEPRLRDEFDICDSEGNIKKQAREQTLSQQNSVYAGSTLWRRMKSKLSPKSGATAMPSYTHEGAWMFRYTSAVLSWLPEKYKYIATGLYLVLCGIIVFALFWTNNYIAGTELGSPATFSCDSYDWGSARGCGVNGVNCQPFLSDTFQPIRCPPWCGHKTGSWYVVGTNPFYRSDSRICMAAVHAGLIDNSKGGCALYRESGPRAYYNGSIENGVHSFNSSEWFPKSFELKKCENPSSCSYMGFTLVLPLTALMYIGLILLGVHSGVYYTSLVVVGYWYVVLIGQPVYSYSFIEGAMGRFLPFMLGAYVLWVIGGRRAVPPPSYMIERFALYWFPTWCFLHMNYLTFIFPDKDVTGGSRVVTDDGGISVLQQGVSWNAFAIFLTCVAVVISAFLLYKQFGTIWRTGCTLQYLTGYIAFATLLLLFAVTVSSHFFFHLHHYQLGMVVVPITAFSTKPSAFAQAILVGLYVQGIGRWGFGSMFTFTGYYPSIPHFEGNITFSNENPTGVMAVWPTANYTETPVYSVVINTVEVCRVTSNTCEITGLLPDLQYHACVRNVVSGYEGKCSASHTFNTTGS